MLLKRLVVAPDKAPVADDAEVYSALGHQVDVSGIARGRVNDNLSRHVESFGVK